jgi:2-polyprenyl-6-methoxyphenol hydroxylase-like FAD-dependent oxidoreductase
MEGRMVYDVLVVGARCSGAAVAAQLAQSGAKVIMIDRFIDVPGDTLSTHFIWPRGATHLKRLGVFETIAAKTPTFENIELQLADANLTGGVRKESVVSRMKSIGIDEASPTLSMLCPRRSLLDLTLFHLALSKGVEFLGGTTFEGAIREPSQVFRVTVGHVGGSRQNI